MPKRGYDPTHINWQAIQHEYVTATDVSVSYRALAQKYNIPLPTFNRIAIREEWNKKRQKYKRDVVNKAVSQACKREAGKLAKVMSSADKLSATIDQVFEDVDQFHRYIVNEPGEDGGTVATEKTYKKVDTRAIRDITASLKDLTAVIRNVYDIPTLQEEQARLIAIERLEMERNKAVLSEPDDGETGVIVLAEVNQSLQEELENA